MAALPVPLPPAKMAAVEKRRPAVAPAANFPDSGRTSVSQAVAAAESEEDFLRQVGVTEMLRAALLKVLETRPEEPIAFLAHYFENMGLRSPANGGAGEPPGQLLLQQQRLGRALWHLRLAHHSQRCGLMAGGGAGTTIPDRPRVSAIRCPRGAFLGVVVCPLFLGLADLRLCGGPVKVLRTLRVDFSCSEREVLWKLWPW